MLEQLEEQINAYDAQIKQLAQKHPDVMKVLRDEVDLTGDGGCSRLIQVDLERPGASQ